MIYNGSMMVVWLALNNAYGYPQLNFLLVKLNKEVPRQNLDRSVWTEDFGCAGWAVANSVKRGYPFQVFVLSYTFLRISAQHE